MRIKSYKKDRQDDVDKMVQEGCRYETIAVAFKPIDPGAPSWEVVISPDNVSPTVEGILYSVIVGQFFRKDHADVFRRELNSALPLVYKSFPKQEAETSEQDTRPPGGKSKIDEAIRLIEDVTISDVTDCPELKLKSINRLRRYVDLLADLIKVDEEGQV